MQCEYSHWRQQVPIAGVASCVVSRVWVNLAYPSCRLWEKGDNFYGWIWFCPLALVNGGDGPHCLLYQFFLQDHAASGGQTSDVGTWVPCLERSLVEWWLWLQIACPVGLFASRLATSFVRRPSATNRMLEPGLGLTPNTAPGTQGARI